MSIASDRPAGQRSSTSDSFASTDITDDELPNSIRFLSISLSICRILDVDYADKYVAKLRSEHSAVLSRSDSAAQAQTQAWEQAGERAYRL
jgi:hypothetical protein